MILFLMGGEGEDFKNLGTKLSPSNQTDNNKVAINIYLNFCFCGTGSCNPPFTKLIRFDNCILQ